MYNDRTSGEQLAVAAALVGVLISRSLTLSEMCIFGNFLRALGDILITIQSQASHTQDMRIKYKKDVGTFIKEQILKQQQKSKTKNSKKASS